MYLILSPRTLYYMFFTSRVSITTYAAANVEHACAVPYLRTEDCMHMRGTNTHYWGKLLLKVLHYNIALLPKKVNNFVTQLLFMESNVLHYFCVTFALLFKYVCF